jgi:hypothetical protein
MKSTEFNIAAAIMFNSKNHFYSLQILQLLFPCYLSLKIELMGLLNQQNKKDDKKSNNKNQKNAGGSKFISKGSKPAGGGVNKKGLTGGSRGS